MTKDKIKRIFRKIFGIATGEFAVVPGTSHCYQVHLPFTPKHVYIDYEVIGIGCSGGCCDICVEKTWKGFVVYYMAVAEKVDFTWIATRF